MDRESVNIFTLPETYPKWAGEVPEDFKEKIGAE